MRETKVLFGNVIFLQKLLEKSGNFNIYDCY